MTSQERLKQELIEAIQATSDDQTLKRVKKALALEAEIIGYEIGTHKPITVGQMKEEFKEIKADMDQGNYFTHEEVKLKFGINED